MVGNVIVVFAFPPDIPINESVLHPKDNQRNKWKNRDDEKEVDVIRSNDSVPVLIEVVENRHRGNVDEVDEP